MKSVLGLHQNPVDAEVFDEILPSVSKWGQDSALE